MDHHSPRDIEFFVDLEKGAEDGGLEQKDFRKLCDQFMSLDDGFVKLNIVDPLKIDNGYPESVLKVVADSKMEGAKTEGKEKRKKASSAKKPPKPPRPPRGFSLDAADQKLIKELAELAMIKRASITRMKALKQKKALKASSSSSSSSISGSLFAMLFTVIFILMIFLQGTSYRSPAVTSQGSPQTNENGLVFIQEQLNPSASDSILPHSKSSNIFEKITGSGSAGKKIQ